jgi:hypothetical protein
MVPCDNEFELASPSSWMTLRTFRHSPSCRSPLVFPSTIPTPDELRSYYPDFVAVDTNRTHWLIETKGAETAEVVYKDSAAKNLVRKRDGAGGHEVAVFGDTLESV